MQATLLRLVGLGLVLTALLAPFTAAASMPPTWLQSPAPSRDNDGDRPAAPAGPDKPPAEIEPALLDTLAVDNAADLVVVMAEQADFSAAYQINDRSARGWYVYDALRKVATRSQSPVVAYAKERGLAHHSFLTTNSVYIEGGNLMAVQDLTTLPGVALIRLPKVVYIHPFREAGPASPNAYGWNLDTLHPDNHQYGMQATQVWDQHGVRGAGIVVANIDTGVYYQHETLDRQYRGNTTGSTGGPYDHNYNWYQPNLLPCGDGTYPCDADGHGSGTIGIMVGENPDQNEQIGVAPGARWIACQGCDDPPYCTELALTGCADWMVAPCPIGEDPGDPGCDPDKRPHIVNNSWGGSGCGTWYQGYVQAWVAAGIFPAFSAGNASGCGTLGSPGDNPEAFSTTAHSSPGTNLYAGGPSCFFPTPSCAPDAHEVDPHLNAPTYGRTADNYAGGYYSLGGTSGASPHTAGTVALMWAANPGYVGQIDDTFTVLEQSANHDVPEGSCGKPTCAGTDPYPNYEYGWGYLDALAAVEMVGVGGVGTLEGTVTDGMLMATVPDATIKASLSPTRSWKTTSSPLGLYSMRLLSGTYTVDACKYGHVPAHITGVSVISGTTTTLNITLPPAAHYIVSGYVTDSATGWPLYASINIDGYPDDPVWSDPATGYYSVTLAEGSTYTFNVAAWVDGYLPASRTVGPLTGEQTKNLSLGADLLACVAPGYEQVPFFYDGFETGSLGPGWSVITTNEGRVTVSTDYPHAGNYSVLLDDSVDGSASSLAAIILTQNLSAQSDVVLDFWWREFSDENHVEDGVFISDDYGTNWYQVLSFNNGPQDFRYDVVDIAGEAAANGLALNDHFWTKFQFYDNYSIPTDGYAVDDVTIRVGCVLQPGGLVVGNAYDGNTSAPLVSATVVNDSGEATTTEATPDDPAVDDGFYTLFSPAGTHIFAATMSGYSPDVDIVTIVQSDTVRHDFYLPAPHIEVSPTTLHHTLELGQQFTQTPGLVISNTGTGGLDFELWEKKGDTWAVDSSNEMVYQAESGESASLCAQDIVPWLTQDPITGAVATSGSLGIDVGWWANVAEVNQPGTYHASLKIKSNDPINQDIVLPVTMTINVPPTWGKLQGTIYSLGHCDGNTTPLEKAAVSVEGSPLTLATDASGAYAVWLEQGTYTMAVSEADHISKAAVVNVTAGMTTTHDVALRWQRSCISVTPLSMEATVLRGTSETQTLTLTNTGAGSTPFEFHEVIQLLDIGVVGSYSYWATTLNADPELSNRYTFVNLGNDWTYATIQDYAGILVNESDVSLTTDETAALRQYYDAGGAILLGMDDVDDEGAIEQADVYYVFGITNAQDGNFYVGTLNPAHPIAQGVTLSNIGNDNDHFDQDDATWVARGGNGNDYVLARDGTARTVVFGEQLSQWWGYGNQQLVRNAIEWAMPFDVDWLSEDPITGTVSADSTFPVEITFTASPTRPTGAHPATLVVQTSDPVNDEINVPVTMTVVTAPDCGFTTSSPDDLGETTYFTNTTSGTPPLTYRWDFGDGSTLLTTGYGAISTAEHPTHTYAHVGFYTVALTATNPYSQSVCTDIVSIEGVEGGFVSNSPVLLGAPAIFTNTTLSNPPIVHYFWTFGDSGSSEDEHPLHTYAAPGIYTVTLIAANTLHTPNNAYDIYQDTVEVSEPFYGVMLAPSTNARHGKPGSTVIYTLRMTNIGNTVDTLTIASSGNTWTTEAVTTVGPLVSGKSADVQVVVHIPAGANEGEHDTVTITSTSQGNGAESDSSVLTTTAVTVQPGAVYLPLVMRRHISTPDLVVDSLIATSNAVTVTIKNQGNGPVSVEDEFWVDVYINPDIEPTHVNQTWEHVGSQGLVWGVTESALPLYPGEALTLTVSDDYYWPDESQVSWPLLAGTPVWAQVDSANADTDYGAVLENHEITGGEYNNVSGPVPSTATFGATGDRRLFDRLKMRPARHGNLPRRH